MFRVNSISIGLVSILSMLIFSPFVLNSSSEDTIASPTLEFHQENGIHFLDLINVSGSSTVPLTSVEVTLWNVTANTQYELLNSSSSLLSVTPYESEFGTTYWEWNHEFQHVSESCTCLVRISLLEQTDLESFGLTVYLGMTNHRPVLMYESKSDQLSQIILTSIDTTLQYEVLLPPNLISLESISPEQEVLASLSVCPAPFGVCVDNYAPITVAHTLEDGDIIITMETLSIHLPDGLYLIDFYVQTMNLKQSNSLSQYFVVDRNSPNVTLSAISEMQESETITVDIDVDDGYEGSVYTVTWTIIEPDGERRAVTSTEVMNDNRLSFTAGEQGVYQIIGLVRDIGGNFVNVQHNVTVLNVEPELDLRFDGFKISNNQTINVKSSQEWCFTANLTTDTVNDIETLEYNWFVDGKSLLSGRSYLLSSDIQADEWKQITLVLTDNNGASTSISFMVEEQETSVESSFQSITLWSIILLLFIVSLMMVVRKKVRTSKESDFVRWSDTKVSDD